MSKDVSMGILSGTEKSMDKQFIFSTMQTIFNMFPGTRTMANMEEFKYWGKDFESERCRLADFT